MTKLINSSRSSVALQSCELHALTSLQWRLQHSSQTVSGPLLCRNCQYSLVISQKGQENVMECRTLSCFWVPVKTLLYYHSV